MKSVIKIVDCGNTTRLLHRIGLYAESFYDDDDVMTTKRYTYNHNNSHSCFNM